MKFILHSYRRCPFCIRTRIFLYLKKIPYEIVEEPLRVWTPWMKEWSARMGERARVPILRILHDENDCSKASPCYNHEQIIPESNEINLFLDAVDGKLEFTPQKMSDAYGEMTIWWKWCAEELKPMIDLYKYGEKLVFDKEKHVEHTTKLNTLMQKLEEALVGKKYLLEERLTLADIAIIPFIRQIMRTREGEFVFSSYPRVLAWTNAIIETDWFKDEVMAISKDLN